MCGKFTSQKKHTQQAARARNKKANDNKAKDKKAKDKKANDKKGRKHTKFFTSKVRKVNIATRRHNLRILYQKPQTQRALLGFSGAPRQNP